MGIKNQRQYTLEFKLQAVQLAEELKSVPFGWNLSPGA